ncbi:MAG TPA: hypothetical protein DCE44_08215 [Verrucomicrobiales bacterium]|nr:hypothetical protein [Verrucomicrobiales bacterium]
MEGKRVIEPVRNGTIGIVDGINQFVVDLETRKGILRPLAEADMADADHSREHPELAAELRRLGRPTPILMLTAKGQVEDRVRGLDSGADDYLVKPFSGDELLARVRAVLRRFDRTQNSPPERLALGNVQVDFVRQEATRNGRPLHLTGKEFAILRLLAETPGQPVSRETFLDRIWGVAAFPTTRTVDTHMSALRAKLERNPNAPSLLTTVHGLGYKLNLPNSQNPDKSHRGSAQAEPGNTSL